MVRSKHEIGDVVAPTWHIAPSAEFARLLEDLGDGILAGPDRAPEDYEEDPIFAKPFGEALSDFRVDAGLVAGGPLPQSIGTPFAAYIDGLWEGRLICESPHDELRIVEAVSPEGLRLGVIALQRRAGGDGARAVGLFTGVTLAVERESQGFGIGRALVMARLLLDERLPTWDLDTPAYSVGGAETVLSAAGALRAMALSAEAATPSAGP